MKKTDIALLILIASISAGLAYWIASATIGESNEKPIIVKTIDAIDTSDVVVDERVFAKDAINPTVDTEISGSDLISFIDEGLEGGPTAEDSQSESDPLIDGALPTDEE